MKFQRTFTAEYGLKYREYNVFAGHDNVVVFKREDGEIYNIYVVGIDKYKSSYKSGSYTPCYGSDMVILEHRGAEMYSVIGQEALFGILREIQNDPRPDYVTQGDGIEQEEDWLVVIQENYYIIRGNTNGIEKLTKSPTHADVIRLRKVVRSTVDELLKEQG